MKIKYLPTSPKSGTVEHVRNDVGATLVAAGFAEACPLARRGTSQWLEDMKVMHSGVPVEAPKVQWGVHMASAARRPVIVANCSNNCNKNFRYDGPVELKDKEGKVVSRPVEKVTFSHSCGVHPAVKVPAEVVKQYAALVSENPVVYTADEAAMIQFAASTGDSGKRRDIFQGRDADGNPIYTKPWW